VKTNHNYHGITLRDDGSGWMLQIRLNGSYRVIRTFAPDVETAARRYDIALNKCIAFADPRAVPNFPKDFPPPPVDTANVSPDYRDFHGVLNNLFHQLIDELEATGQSYDELEENRAKEVKRNSETVSLSQKLARVKLTGALTKVIASLPKCGLNAAQVDHITSLCEQAQLRINNEPTS
jgi:hypothetical protein